jgi:MscS family membrane protein
VAAISEMYQEIRDFPVVDQPFATPVFYRDFVYTPGYLVPPAWYLALPRNVRDLIEVPISDQTLFQIACAALAIVLSLLFLAWLGSFMLQTYRERASQAPEGDPWNQDRLAWRRVLIVLPILPLTRFTEVFIDDVVNFTGLPLAVITYALYVIWYLTAGVFMFFVFEAVGWRHPAAAATGQQSGDAPLPCLPSRPCPVWPSVWAPRNCSAICSPASRFRPIGPCGSASSAGSATTWAS